MPSFAGAERADEIDVLSVDPTMVSRWTLWRSVRGEVLATWSGDRVPEVLRLIETLPGSRPMRCFKPRYAVRLRRGAEVLTEIGLCFACHNAVAFTGGTERSFVFDPHSPPAQELLRLLRSADPAAGPPGRD